MRIQTTRFGELEIPEESVISFSRGILGFPDVKRYVVLDHDSDDTPFKWLQSVENAGLAFVVIDPLIIVSEYNLLVSEEAINEFGDVDAKDIAVMAIVKIPHDDPTQMTMNLKAPIIVDLPERRAHQVILRTDTYPLQYPILSEDCKQLNPSSV